MPDHAGVKVAFLFLFSNLYKTALSTGNFVWPTLVNVAKNDFLKQILFVNIANFKKYIICFSS